MSNPILSLNGVHKSYVDASGTKTDVIKGIDLDVEDGEFVAILGFSGSGKTTLMSMIAGLEQPDSGEVIIKGEVKHEPGAERGLVFQSYSLFPWLTVEGNVRLAVETVHADLSKEEQTNIINATIALVGLDHATDRKPAQLSGGMRQRVAVARALAMKPEILLLDEPLSALDALTRAKLQDEIERIRSKDKRTIVLITNDVDEALLLADRIAVLEPPPSGKLGRIFDVNLARPRERTSINNDAAYKQLRNEIAGYLADLDSGKARLVGAESLNLPNVTPIDLLKPPKAYLEASRTNMERRYLEFYKLKKVYPTPKGPLTVLEDFNILMDKGNFISLIGHSGCGKSTALTMAAGLNEITGGSIILDGREISTAGPDKAVVFQAPSLMPWLTARDNVAMGVERVYPHTSKAERKDIVEYYLSRVGLADAMDKRAADLSNGMKQRVGIARAFALSPKLLLLDEPFGMLDSLTRWELQDVLMEVWDRTKVTAICVTHDVDEAILLADRVVMMTNGPNATIGKVLDVDLPRPRERQALLEHPKFYDYRAQVLQFLEDYEKGAHADVA